MTIDSFQAQIASMKATLDPWYQALSDPAKAQEIVLEKLLKGYNQTEDGRKQKSENVGSYSDFKKAYPVRAYADFKPLIDEVVAGNTYALLPEEPLAFMLTKGTTGESKLFPYTPTHARMYGEYMLRQTIGLSLLKNDFEWLSSYRLNLVSSANIGTIKVGEKELIKGYAIAVATSLLDDSNILRFKPTPTADEMKSLPTQPSKENWEKRYEFIYQAAREKDVVHISTVPGVAVGFGRYLYRAHHIYPKDVWQIKYAVLGGFTGIHNRYAPIIHDLFGKKVDVWELYVSTEGAYGSQLDNKKAWCPFYDHLFFEVQTISGIKQLHEMYPGEIGSLIVSTPDLPRYQLRDLILAFEPPYFRCIGRENTKLFPYKFGKLTGKSSFNFSKPNLISYK